MKDKDKQWISIDAQLIKNRIDELIHRREHPSLKTLPPSDRNDVVSFLNGEIEALEWVMDHCFIPKLDAASKPPSSPL